MKYNKILISIAMILIGPGSSFPASTSTNLNVTGFVGPTISASVRGSYLNFNTTVGHDASAVGYLYINGTSGQAHRITMDSGLNYDGVFRRISDGYGNYIRYSIVKPVGGEWGDSDFNNTFPSGSSIYYIGTGYDDSISFNAYLYPPTIPGNYYDTVSVTINW